MSTRQSYKGGRQQQQQNSGSGGGGGNNYNFSNRGNKSGGGGGKPWHSPHQPAATPPTAPVAEKSEAPDPYVMHHHDRTLYLFMHLTGHKVKVTVKNGTQFEGLFHAANTEGDIGVVLRQARKLPVNDEPLISYMVIPSKEMVMMEATNVEFSFPFSEMKNDPSGVGGERALRKWADYDQDEELTGLEEDGWLERQRWDQFAANERLFGVKTDYDEELYTTKLDRNAPDFKEREKKAIHIANEIAKQPTANIHMLEERGVVVDESVMDEEDRYAGVVRPSTKLPAPSELAQTSTSTSATVPTPEVTAAVVGEEKKTDTTNNENSNNKDNEAQNKDDAANSNNAAASGSKLPPQMIARVREELLKGGTAPLFKFKTGAEPKEFRAPTKEELLKSMEKIKITARSASFREEGPPPTIILKTDDKVPEPIGVTRSVSMAGTPLSKEKTEQLKNELLKGLSEKKDATATIRQTILAKLDRKIAEKKPIEVQVTTMFKKFANSEKERYAQKKQALMKKEKESRLQDLVKFSKTFTLPTPVPEDLPLLRKDSDLKKEKDSNETKNAEEISSSNTTATAKTTITTTTTTTAVATTTATSTTAAIPITPRVSDNSNATNTTVSNAATNGSNNSATNTAATNANEASTPTGASFKFNVKASEFRPNPTAAPFVPTTKKQEQPAYNMFFGDKPLKKEPLKVMARFKTVAPDPIDPTDVSPVWNSKIGGTYRMFFQVTNIYDDPEIYQQAMLAQQYNFPYPVYRMPPPPPQFVSSMPYPAAAAAGYLPPHAAHQGAAGNNGNYGSPSMSPMVPHRVFQPQGKPPMPNDTVQQYAQPTGSPYIQPGNIPRPHPGTPHMFPYQPGNLPPGAVVMPYPGMMAAPPNYPPGGMGNPAAAGMMMGPGGQPMMATAGTGAMMAYPMVMNAPPHPQTMYPPPPPMQQQGNSNE